VYEKRLSLKILELSSFIFIQSSNRIALKLNSEIQFVCRYLNGQDLKGILRSSKIISSLSRSDKQLNCMKILIIEDEKELSDSISTYLSSEQFTCEAAYDYDSAILKIHMNEYSCIILDITLPNGNGLDILKKLKSMDKAEGVLIVSARNSLDDKIAGLNSGADDYLAKPFHLPELCLRSSVANHLEAETRSK
jgi:CheY-like chemotaxis protein